MSYLLTFCAGLLGIAGLIVWAWRTKDPDQPDYMERYRALYLISNDDMKNEKIHTRRRTMDNPTDSRTAATNGSHS